MKKILIGTLVAVVLVGLVSFGSVRADNSVTLSSTTPTTTLAYLTNWLNKLSQQLDVLEQKIKLQNLCFGNTQLTNSQTNTCQQQFPNFSVNNNSNNNQTGSGYYGNRGNNNGSSGSGLSDQQSLALADIIKQLGQLFGNGQGGSGLSSLLGQGGGTSPSAAASDGTGALATGGGGAGTIPSGVTPQSGAQDSSALGDSSGVTCQEAKDKEAEWEKTCALGNSNNPTDCSNENQCRQLITQTTGYTKKGDGNSLLFNHECSRTRVSGLKGKLLVFLACLREECDASMGAEKCKITIRAGNDPQSNDGHSGSTSNHYQGLAVDLAHDSALDNFINTRARYGRFLPGTSITCGEDKDKGGNGGTHWHCSPTGK